MKGKRPSVGRGDLQAPHAFGRDELVGAKQIVFSSLSTLAPYSFSDLMNWPLFASPLLSAPNLLEEEDRNVSSYSL